MADRKKSNLRLALVLAAVAFVFFAAVIAKRLLG